MQRKEIHSWGSMNELVFAFSANLGDRVYLGAAMGFPFLRYFEESYYTEIDGSNEIEDFHRLSIYDELSTRGTGFNLKFGTIVRINDIFRVGGAIHSPTWYNNMRDEWYSDFYTAFDNGESFTERAPFGSYDYQLETPWKAIASASAIIGNVALVSAEYEFIDYSKSRLRSYGYSYYDENNTIRTNYRNAHAIRIGSEYRLDVYSFRLGGGYYTSPFENGVNSGERFFFSGGAGFRSKSFFADIAYLQSFIDEDYFLYGSENVTVNPAENRFVTYNLLLTCGFRF